MPRKDTNQLALTVVQRATDENKVAPSKRQAAGRLGGKAGGKSRSAKLTAKQKSEIAKKAAQARWKKEPATKAGSR